MRYQKAIKLHNEDEVTIKSTGEIVTVLSTFNYPDEKEVVIYAVINGVYNGIDHKRIS
jgi:hypothetical protein